jgi:nucleotide-binding universal stress UspA family protein
MDWPYRKIACCIDRDEAAEDVLREAARLAAGAPEALHVLHVLAPPHAFVAGPFAYIAPMVEMRDETESWLGEIAAEIPGAIPVLLDGAPVHEVSEWARSNAVDLIVASAHRGLIERAVLGGFASHLAYHAPCPVLFVHPSAGATADALVATAAPGEPA